MTLTAEPPLTLPDLQRLLTAADPAALLLKPRLLRRVIRQHARAGGLLPPHTQCYVIDSPALLALVGRDDLGLAPDRSLPAQVILLPRPEPEDLAAESAGAALVRCWRRLFHARVHLALDRKAADGKLTDADVRRRVERLGRTEFDEIRTVLRQEKTLLPPGDDRAVYTEFAALALELRFFEPTRLHLYFPAVTDWEGVDALLAEDVEAEALFAATRLQGAPDSVSAHLTGAEEDEDAPATPPASEKAAAPPPREAPEQARGQAEQAAGRGNLVRAALLRARSVPAGAGAEAFAAAAHAELDQFAGRLQHALRLSDPTAATLREALPPLLARAASGGWTLEARLLYDLQKACVDQERGIFGVHLLGWALSLGRRPLKRPRPGEQEVLVYRHVRAAVRKAPRAHLAEADRRRLVTVLGAVLRHAAARLRDYFRPLVAGCFEQVGLTPTNLPERVARDKLVEELLDRIVDRGFLTIGDLRDAVSRNQLKLPDLAGPGEWLSGDPLLRLNSAMVSALDGAYRPGEVYLRGLQRVSSLAFGTVVGRLLVRFLLLPFGVAFVALRGTDLLAEEAVHLSDWLAAKLGGHAAGHGPHYHPTHLATPWAVGALALFLILLFNVAPFRRKVFRGLRIFGLFLHGVLIDAPVWVLHHPALRAFLESAPVAFFRRYLAVPLLAAALTGAILAVCGVDGLTNAYVSGGVFIVLLAVLNTRLGRDVQEVTADRFLRFWQWVAADLLPGLFRWVMRISRWFLEGVDRLLYTVDEWLRFRSGESRLSLALKGVAGMVWGTFAYIVRIYTNLLVEPTVNPIKHFPVVTVGHKLMLPFLVVLYHFLLEQLGFLGPVLGRGFVVVTIFFLPGIFGFIVWELKENWKLYRANRPEALKPVLIGSHGETMLRLLRPGFHSGTVPRLFAKLRRAERKGRARGVRKYHEGLHHVEESVHRFVEREFLHLLAQSKSWGGLRLGLQEVGLATNRVRLELACADLADTPVEVTIDFRDGWLVAGVREAGWLLRLSGPQREALAAALAGLYKLAGVDLTREQIAAAFAPVAPPYHVTRPGLVVWAGPDGRGEALYPLGDGELLGPGVASGSPPPELPVLERERLLFSATPIRWQQWVETWQRDQAGEGAPRVFEPTRLLPTAEHALAPAP
jgi:hypothetical protein